MNNFKTTALDRGLYSQCQKDGFKHGRRAFQSFPCWNEVWCKLLLKNEEYLTHQSIHSYLCKRKQFTRVIFSHSALDECGHTEKQNNFENVNIWNWYEQNVDTWQTDACCSMFVLTLKDKLYGQRVDGPNTHFWPHWLCLIITWHGFCTQGDSQVFQIFHDRKQNSGYWPVFRFTDTDIWKRCFSYSYIDTRKSERGGDFKG